MKRNCPDCGSPLGPSAFKCRCGWSELNPGKQPIDLGAIFRRYEQRSKERWEAAGCPSAAESMAKIKEIVARQKPTPTQHWQRVLKTPGLDPTTYETARNCLKRLGWREREPGEDDEVVAA